MNTHSVPGQVIELLPNSLYKVKLTDGREFLCYSAGKLKVRRVHIIVGEMVQVVLDPYNGRATNRIISVGRPPLPHRTGR